MLCERMACAAISDIRIDGDCLRIDSVTGARFA
jgi:hypothetical protein